MRSGGWRRRWWSWGSLPSAAVSSPSKLRLRGGAGPGLAITALRGGAVGGLRLLVRLLLR